MFFDHLIFLHTTSLSRLLTYIYLCVSVCIYTQTYIHTDTHTDIDIYNSIYLERDREKKTKYFWFTIWIETAFKLQGHLVGVIATNPGFIGA